MNKNTKRFEPNELVWYYDEDNMAYQATVLATQDYSTAADWYYVVLVGGKDSTAEPFSMQSHRVFRTLQHGDCDRLEDLSRAATAAINKFITFAQKTNVFRGTSPAPQLPTKERLE